MGNNKKEVKTENGNLPISNVMLSSLIAKAQLENEENKRKAFENRNKKVDDIEPFENKDFLNMVCAVKDALN